MTTTRTLSGLLLALVLAVTTLTASGSSASAASAQVGDAGVVAASHDGCVKWRYYTRDRTLFIGLRVKGKTDVYVYECTGYWRVINTVVKATSRKGCKGITRGTMNPNSLGGWDPSAKTDHCRRGRMVTRFTPPKAVRIPFYKEGTGAACIGSTIRLDSRRVSGWFDTGSVCLDIKAHQ